MRNHAVRSVWYCAAAVGILLGMVSCGEQPEALSLPDCVTPTLFTLEEIATVPAASSPISTPSPVAASFSTPTPFPEVSLPASPAGYRLRAPDPPTLLMVMELAQGYTRYEDSRYVRRLASHQSDALYRLIEADVRYYYANGIPDAAGLRVPSLAGHYGSKSPQARVAWQVMLDRLEQYLNEHAVHLEPETTQTMHDFSFTSYALEPIAGNPAWLLHFWVPHDSQGDIATGFILLEEGDDGRYRQLPGPKRWYMMPGLYAPSRTEVHVDYDLVGGPARDVVIHHYGHSGGSTNYWTLDIYAWEPSGLQLAVSTEKYHNLLQNLYEPGYTIGDFTGDGRDDVRVETVLTWELCCDCRQVELYSWAGDELDYTSTGVPDVASCNAWQGLNTDDPAQILTFLEKAIAQWSVEITPSVDMLALIHLRLAMTYVGQGRDTDALRTLETVHRMPEDAAVVQWIRRHLEKLEDENLIAFYHRLHLDRASIRHLEPASSWLPSPRDLVDQRLQAMSLPASLSPVDALAEAGLFLAFDRPVDLNGDGDEVWVGILQPELMPQVIILDAGGEHWQPILKHELYFDELPAVAFEFLLQDVTADGALEIVAQITRSGVSTCGADALEYILLVLIPQDQPYDYDERLFYERSCTPYSLETIDPAYFDRLLPSWYTLLDFSDSHLSLPAYVTVLETEVISQTHPLRTAGSLDALLAYLPEDDVALGILPDEVRYLQGLNYERMGHDAQAVAIYEDLMRRSPGSPWSWLAWARLEAVETD